MRADGGAGARAERDAGAGRHRGHGLDVGDGREQHAPGGGHAAVGRDQGHLLGPVRAALPGRHAERQEPRPATTTAGRGAPVADARATPRPGRGRGRHPRRPARPHAHLRRTARTRPPSSSARRSADGVGKPRSWVTTSDGAAVAGVTAEPRRAARPGPRRPCPRVGSSRTSTPGRRPGSRPAPRARARRPRGRAGGAPRGRRGRARPCVAATRASRSPLAGAGELAARSRPRSSTRSCRR